MEPKISGPQEPCCGAELDHRSMGGAEGLRGGALHLLCLGRDDSGCWMEEDEAEMGTHVGHHGVWTKEMVAQPGWRRGADSGRR